MGLKAKPNKELLRCDAHKPAAVAIRRQRRHPTANNSENCGPVEIKAKLPAAALLLLHAQCGVAEAPRFFVAAERLGLVKTANIAAKASRNNSPALTLLANRCIGRLEAKSDNNNHNCASHDLSYSTGVFSAAHRLDQEPHNKPHLSALARPFQ